MGKTRVRFSLLISLVLLMYSVLHPVAASAADTAVPADNSEDLPDMALLEFLGNTAGLESLGVNLDQLLASADKPENTRKRDEKSED